MEKVGQFPGRVGRGFFENVRGFSDMFERVFEDFVSVPRRRFYVLLVLLL